MSGNNVQMGAFTVVGYLLYRFSQTLPALIRWPIRLFCSLTGLTAIWGWVSRVVGTLRGIQSLCKWLSRVWRFFVAIACKFKWLNTVIKAITGEQSVDLQTDVSSSVRLILLGPAGAGRTSLADTLLGNKDLDAHRDPLRDTGVRRTVVDGTDLTVIDTPDLLGTSLRDSRRAKEALRSLQLTGPGPHALLLVIQVPDGPGVDLDVTRLIRVATKLYGEDVLGYIVPVLTHAARLGPTRSADKLLAADAGGLQRGVSLCGQKPELVDNGPEQPPEAQAATRRRLVGRVKELRQRRGHFVHELQTREDRLREELLDDMASALAKRLGH